MSRRIESVNKLKVYEIDGTDTYKVDGPTITVSEHWSKKGFVRIKIGETSYTVDASALKKAIENAQNAHDGF